MKREEVAEDRLTAELAAVLGLIEWRSLEGARGSLGDDRTFADWLAGEGVQASEVDRLRWLARRLGDREASAAGRVAEIVGLTRDFGGSRHASDLTVSFLDPVDAHATTQPGGHAPVDLGLDDRAWAGAPRADARYTITSPVDGGGCGDVFVATDNLLKREVALKVIKPRHADVPRQRRLFERESEIGGRIHHPGVPPVYDRGRLADGRPCFTMRRVPGETLSRRIEAHADLDGAADPAGKRLALRSLVENLRSACRTLAFVHAEGYCHRDVKPANIMVDLRGETYVIDWGLAKPLHRSEETASTNGGGGGGPSSETDELQERTSQGDALGTVPYMAPEQVAGELHRVGALSDVYGLGATLYKILTDRPPIHYVQGHFPAAKADILAANYKRPRQIDPTVPRPLEAIALKALALDPDHRYATADAMADDLTRWLAGDAVSVDAEPLSERAARRLSRNLPLAIAGLVFLTVGLTATSIGLAVLNQLRAHAEASRDEALAGMLRILRFQIEGARSGEGASAQHTLEAIRDQIAAYADNHARDEPRANLIAAVAARDVANFVRDIGRYADADAGYQAATTPLARVRADSSLRPEADRVLVSVLLDRSRNAIARGSAGDAASALKEAGKLLDRAPRAGPRSWSELAPDWDALRRGRAELLEAASRGD